MIGSGGGSVGFVFFYYQFCVIGVFSCLKRLKLNDASGDPESKSKATKPINKVLGRAIVF